MGKQKRLWLKFYTDVAVNPIDLGFDINFGLNHVESSIFFNYHPPFNFTIGLGKFSLYFFKDLGICIKYNDKILFDTTHAFDAGFVFNESRSLNEPPELERIGLMDIIEKGVSDLLDNPEED